jgi:hypothetical protein
MPRKQTRNPQKERIYFGQSYDAKRTREGQGNDHVLIGNHVSSSLAAGSTHQDLLSSIARDSVRPLPIKFLSEKLKEGSYVRGRGCFGEIAHEIDKIVQLSLLALVDYR